MTAATCRTFDKAIANRNLTFWTQAGFAPYITTSPAVYGHKTIYTVHTDTSIVGLPPGELGALAP